MADCFTDEGPIQQTQPLFLGVLGSRPDVSAQALQENILTPMLQELGRTPDKVILPVEGLSNILISDWAEQLRIPTQIYDADWQRHQKRAKIFRDLRIQKEATHFLIFLNKRSTFNEKLAERLAIKGYTVFTVAYRKPQVVDANGRVSSDTQHYKGLELEQLVIEQSCEPSPPARPAERGSKRGTGTAQGLRQWLQSGCPESQCLQIDPSEA